MFSSCARRRTALRRAPSSRPGSTVVAARGRPCSSRRGRSRWATPSCAARSTGGSGRWSTTRAAGSARPNRRRQWQSSGSAACPGPAPTGAGLAEREGVDIRIYAVIYEAVNDGRYALEGLLEPTFHEKVLGRAEVRQVFAVSGIGQVAGCAVTDGKIVRGAKARLL